MRLYVLVGILVLLLPANSYGQEKTQKADADLNQRQREILDGIVKFAPWDCPDRWLYELGDPKTRAEAVRKRMLEATSWIDFLALANVLDWSTAERGNTAEFLLQNLPKIKSGKARQNIIFLVALTTPDAKESLRKVFESGDNLITNEDKLDAGCALAGLGDEKAIEWFISEFKTTEIFLGRPVFKFDDYKKEEADETNRESVRSYRFWEVIFRRPYYKRLQFLARAGIYRMTAQEVSDAQRDALAARLLPVFITKWHGHPGSDDIAMRMLNCAIQEKDLRGIYIWAQRASLLPDQDCCESAFHIFTALADSQLSVEELDQIIVSPDGKQNRDFLLYERFIRTARKDVKAGIEYFDKIALSEPSSLFAAARRAAAEVAPPEALRDGSYEDLTLKIMLGYPKRSQVLAETQYKEKEDKGEEDYVSVLTAREREVVLRTRLQRQNSISISSEKLARQYRLLFELKNLKEMEEAEGNSETAADLRYRQAKFFYRDPDTIFPVWATPTEKFGYRLNAVRYDEKSDERLSTYVAETFALRIAFDTLNAILKSHPTYKGRDNVLFHLAQAYAKLMDYPPAKAVDVWVYPDKPEKGSPEGKLEYAHRQVAELFQKVVDEFPESQWAEVSERGAQWRTKMVKILRSKREKEEKQNKNK